MFIRVLGSAAGGGFPQWNCDCPTCRRARTGHRSIRARTTDSLAVSDNGKSWYLINATPDVGAQVEAFAALHPGPYIRETPIRGVILTDAELDHTIGLLQMRENAEIEVYAPSCVLQALSGPLPIRRILEPYAKFHWSNVEAGESFWLFEERLNVYPFRLGCKPPRYATASVDKEKEAWVMGYRITDRLTGGVFVYAPGIESWTDELTEHLSHADCVMIDGTFWEADELQRLGVSDLLASEMGHVPISGPSGSLERLADLTAKRKIYIHINNTNPILDEHSAEYHRLRSLGIEIGFDGLAAEV
ncbi:pyrroloquinoline quinone biosynthesis protein PqqB [Cohnella soli]|uniref:Coenzyme PQQ synthesis protein B n=1 Tax=Cohnella soli TaxID=425005 RepID=A0ABW0HJR6_9BACL